MGGVCEGTGNCNRYGIQDTCLAKPEDECVWRSVIFPDGWNSYYMTDPAIWMCFGAFFLTFYDVFPCCHSKYEAGTVDAYVISPNAAIILLPMPKSHCFSNLDVPELGDFVNISMKSNNSCTCCDRYKEWMTFPVVSVEMANGIADKNQEDIGMDNDGTCHDAGTYPRTENQQQERYGIFVGGFGDWTQSFIYSIAANFETVNNTLYVQNHNQDSFMHYAENYERVLYVATDGGIGSVLSSLDADNWNTSYLMWFAYNPSVTFGKIYRNV